MPSRYSFAAMLKLTAEALVLSGPGGELSVPPGDPVLPKLAMLYEGDCEGLGPSAAARKFGYCKQRYFQLRRLLQRGGILALQNHKRGPRTNYRRPDTVIAQVVRYRFLDPDGSAAVIAQKLRQSAHPISTRTVERVIAQFGLQKKTARVSAGPVAVAPGRNAAHQAAPTRASGRSRKARTGRPPASGR